MQVNVAFPNLPDVLRAFSRATDQVGEGCRRGVTMGVREGVGEMLATKTWKDRTGNTRRATRGYVTVARREGAEGVMECLAETASWLDSGTVPHVIRPKEGHRFVGPLKEGQSRRKKTDIGTHRVALRWYDAGGSPVFRGVVHHPGTTGDGWFARGVQKCERVMIREIELGVVQAQRALDA